MSKRNIVALSLLLLFVLGGGVVWISAVSPVRGQSGAEDGKQMSSPLAQLNEKARTVKGYDEDSIRAMGDEVFHVAGLDQAPAGMLDSIKERLVRSELNYRSGRNEGISEINVVRTVNDLADQFKAPDYAKTNPYEVKQLRASLLRFLPNFIGSERPEETRKSKAVGSSLNTKLSPMEAAFITMLLVQQKLTNPQYQMTQAERISTWDEKHGDKKTTSRNQTTGPKSEENEARSSEMRGVIDRGVSQTAPVDLLNIPSRALDVLGVDKEEGGEVK